MPLYMSLSDDNNGLDDGSALWIQTKPATVNFHHHTSQRNASLAEARPGKLRRWIRTSGRIDRSSRDPCEEVLCLEHLMETKSDSTPLVGELCPLIGLAANERQCTNCWPTHRIEMAKKLEHISQCSSDQSFSKTPR